MIFRTALIAALISGASLSAAATDSVPAPDHRNAAAVSLQQRAQGSWLVTPRQHERAPANAPTIPFPDPLGDVVNGRGPDERTPLMVQFAVYASIGDRVGMEIVSQALGEFGTSREELEDFAAYAPLHARSPAPPAQLEREMQQGWNRSY